MDNSSIISSIKNGGFPATMGVRFSCDEMAGIRDYFDAQLLTEKSEVIKKSIPEYFYTAIITRCDNQQISELYKRKIMVNGIEHVGASKLYNELK